MHTSAAVSDSFYDDVMEDTRTSTSLTRRTGWKKEMHTALFFMCGKPHLALPLQF